MEAVRKITVREILKGKPEKEAVTITNDDGSTATVQRVKSAPAAVIYGQAHSVESGSSQYGPYSVFIGRFEARRVKDGAVFQSTRVIFPQIAEDIALQHFMDAKAQDETAMVDMAFVVGVEYDARGTEGYKFTVSPVQTGEQRVDPLAALRAAMAPNLATLLPAGVAQALQLTDQSAAASDTTEGKAASKSKDKQPENA